jgi:hypothetical protein
MPKLSKDTAPDIEDAGPAMDRGGPLDEYTVDFVTIREGHSLAPVLKGLPGDSCQCPHWGYVTSGTLTFRFADREEVCEAGDAFYVGPGHTPSATAGTEYLQFSPADELQAVTAAIVKNMQAMQSA